MFNVNIAEKFNMFVSISKGMTFLNYTPNICKFIYLKLERVNLGWNFSCFGMCRTQIQLSLLNATSV